MSLIPIDEKTFEVYDEETHERLLCTGNFPGDYRVLGPVAQNIIVRDRNGQQATVNSDGQLVVYSEEAEEVEEHVHNTEYWFGSDGRVVGGSAGDAPYQATTGAADYGTALAVLLTGDTPVTERPNATKFDVHRILVTAVSENEAYSFRLVWSDTSAANGVTNYQYTESKFFSTAGGAVVSGTPVDMICPRLPVGTPVWLQCFTDTDAATMDFFIGIHLYPRPTITTI